MNTRRNKSTPPAPLSRGGKKENLRSPFGLAAVLKFGGTSMGDARSIEKVAGIVMEVSEQAIVVVSATSGTTDNLIALCERALRNENWQKTLEELIERHRIIVDDLGIDLDLADFWKEVKKLAEGIQLVSELSPSAKDKMMAFGERISSRILAALLKKRGVEARALDAYNFVFTDNNFGEGNVNFEKTNAAVREQVETPVRDGVVPVITGFVGQSKNGQYITLGRGGSDYTAAIVAAAMDAGELQIWTDVDGILNADPRLVSRARVIDGLSFGEASELAYFGAKVLHPKTIKPAVEKDIPVKILNTFNPKAPGTLITNEEEESVKSVTYKKGISIINVCSAGMLEARGFLARLFEIFARYQIAVDVIATSEVSVSLTIDNGIPHELISALEEFATVNVFENMAIVCLVGGEVRSNKGILGKLFSGLADHNVSMVSQGASKRNITFLVEESEAPEVVKKVFNTFFS